MMVCVYDETNWNWSAYFSSDRSATTDINIIGILECVVNNNKHLPVTKVSLLSSFVV